jgi:CHASE2 domain-containing sensor protein
MCVSKHQISKFTKTLLPMHKEKSARAFWLDVFLCSTFVFSVLYGITNILQLGILDVFDPIGQALGDTELTDITFSRLREDPEIDTNILIVNTSTLSSLEVAQQIRNLSKFKPKVIAIDVFYNCPAGFTDSINCPIAYDTLRNPSFGEAIANASNVVMVTKLLQTDSLSNANGGDIDIYDSLEHSIDILRPNAFEGYANLETDAEHQEDLKSCRRFYPQVTVNGQNELAFSVRTAMLFDSKKTKRFLERDKDVEVINFRGNIIDMHGASEYAGRYFTLDWFQALDTNQFVPGLVKDKIILMGFLGENFDDTSWDDKFFTPLNKKFAGKSRPDMYGLVVHANIISMILAEDYVTESADWIEYVVAFILCMLNVAVFFLISKRIPLWFDGLSIVMQLTQIIILSLLMVYFFHWFHVKLNLTATLGALAVVGTGFELYNSIIKQFWRLYLSKFLKNYMKILGFLSSYVSIKRHK